MRCEMKREGWKWVDWCGANVRQLRIIWITRSQGSNLLLVPLVLPSSRESDTDDHFIQFFLYRHDYNLGYRGPVNYSVMLMVSFYGTAVHDGDGDGDGGVCDEEVENLGWELAGYGANVPPLSARPKLEKCWKYGEPEI